MLPFFGTETGLTVWAGKIDGVSEEQKMVCTRMLHPDFVVLGGGGWPVMNIVEDGVDGDTLRQEVEESKVVCFTRCVLLHNILFNE